MFRPTVFIASASESLDVVNAIQAVLDHNVDLIPWQLSFPVSSYTITSLTSNLDKCDFGVFVMDPLDTAVSRGEKKSIARDNVIFELGMFIGRLGLDRAFVVKPKGRDLSLPSDLNGVTLVDRQSAAPNGWQIAVNGACTKMWDAMNNLGFHSQRLEPLTGLVAAYDLAEKIKDPDERVNHMNRIFEEMKDVFRNAPRGMTIAKAPFAKASDRRYLIACAAAVIEDPTLSDFKLLQSIKPSHIRYGNAQHKFADAIYRLFDLPDADQSDRQAMIQWLQNIPNPEPYFDKKINGLLQRLAS
jgi:hypothetical protein